ncbi:MAG: DUF3604 domain-containing protein [Pseudomonadota bacterium]
MRTTDVRPAAFGVLLALSVAGCSGEVRDTAAADVAAASGVAVDPSAEAAPSIAESGVIGRCTNYVSTGMPLFGDLHVHTSYSFDAAANSTGATPDDANRYARGEVVPFWPIGADGKPTGTAQIDRPLDFLAVTDHGEFLGERALCSTPGSPSYDTVFCRGFRADQRQGMLMLGTVITSEAPQRIGELCGADGALCRDYARGPWADIQDAANAANEPCAFTSFIGYEYTGTPGTSNYHRNVIFRGDVVPPAPVSYVDAPIDSALWEGLDRACRAEDGCDYLTIPHNTNLANGRMAPYRKLPDTPDARRAYAAQRLAREPVMEIFQHKGGSECINGLSTVLGAPDELCTVEAVRRLGEAKTYATRTGPASSLQVGQATVVTRECAPGEIGTVGMLGAGCVHPTDFQRSALAVGLREEAEVGLNPIKLGIIASTDTHAANPGGVIESDWGGAVTGESTPAERLQTGVLTSGIDGNPGGLAGVWASENTRDAIFDALKRREVFGTSGPRIAPRLFAGWGYDPALCGQPDRDAAGYAGGVPMGSDLPAPTVPAKPRFLAYAGKDPTGGDLTALQLIKGWVDAEGGLHTEVLPIAASEGAAALCSVYVDEAFDARLPTYYYLRVVEQRVPRWHTYDCARLPPAERPAVCSNGAYPDTVVEMAWTSPIWFRPEDGSGIASAGR